ncbi:uncharacterized protein Z520_05259 [Fonsecaea multimorphosa CBS 102226]|uniref:Uncharacterized protein n=1 Tax=Fonsecaea multimorphosa CBS 102226 TaxID=1442371 RepID=A0A0D2KPZ3_9EURO|nr:uncharacterized protein Z520_05259 [Fonsecaea multimorphosa CBS 102226]KIX98798.1 hypothetical protein Z520_05259 [Fonsecaea multimorphosa CBS 102226]OAL25079.1 hypothetical protein AYO22_04956 [Fonsecaea multimorphosa]
MSTNLTASSVYSFPDVDEFESTSQTSSNSTVADVISPANAGAYLAASGISYTEDGDITVDAHLRGVDFSDGSNSVQEHAAAPPAPTWRFVGSDEIECQSNVSDGSTISWEEGEHSETDDGSVDSNPSDEGSTGSTETESTRALSSYTAAARYLCLIVVTDMKPEPRSNPAAPRKQYVMSLEVKQDRPFTRHHIRLPHASIVIHMHWDHVEWEPQYQIRQLWQVPGHMHGVSCLHHDRVDDMPCMGRRFARGWPRLRLRSPVHQWDRGILRPLDEGSDDEVPLE